ncbi:MAG: hypothetical protein HY868_01390 [Chloroflexi bacterium]|nr:hypothetical protein [Chloroflexota bacterium]
MEIHGWRSGLLALAIALFASLALCTTSAQAAVTLSSFDARVAREGTTSRVVLMWKTVSEIHIAGFNLYRSNRAEGPYTRINAQLIPASDNLVIGGTYQYLNDVQPGQTYYYQLEDVETNGKSTRHAPVAVTALETQLGSSAWISVCWGIGAVLVILGGLNLALRAKTTT